VLSIVPATTGGDAPALPQPLDDESREFVAALRSRGRRRDDAIARLHALLLRAATFEVDRRRRALAHQGGDGDEIAQEAAADALLGVLRRLDDYRGLSRFTTWAYKFALLEAAVKVRRCAWQKREVLVEPEVWPLVPQPGPSVQRHAEQYELLRVLQHAITTELTPHQRDVLVALVLNDVPIDVLAERLSTTRGALYKTLHDARGRLRAAVAAAGLDPPSRDRRGDR
jgi:RNA polymerase sigma-70 factor, ECF subfamily